MNLASDIVSVGVLDRDIDLFEGQFPVPDGISYNSWLVLSGKTAVMNAVDGRFQGEWLENIRRNLGGKGLDFLVVQHAEPDHAGSIGAFMAAFPDAKIVASAAAFGIIKAFFGTDWPERKIVVGEGATLSLEGRTLRFIAAPMVHWPDVLFVYEEASRTLWSADGFGTFGADLSKLEDWACEARRYYFGIVGKFGMQVQAVLKKVSALDIAAIAPLHGPVLRADALANAVELYGKWSRYEPETPGVCVAYASAHGNTQALALALAERLVALGCPAVETHDLTRGDMSEAVEAAFRYPVTVVASPTYNADAFPAARFFLEQLLDRAWQKRTVAFVETGAWAPTAAKALKARLEKAKDIKFAANGVSVKGALNAAAEASLDALARELLPEAAAPQSSSLA